MILLQAIAQVRVVLNESTPRFWTNSEITDWLNEGAALMCREAKYLTSWYQTASTAQQQEYPMPRDCMEIVAVWYAQGTLLPLQPLEESIVKSGARAAGLPLWCYVRQGATQLAQVDATPNIAISPITGQLGSRYPQLVLGLYPIPTGTNDLTVMYYQQHYQVINMTDQFAVPSEYMRGVIAYAAGMGKAKEQAVAEFDKQMSIFKEFKDRFCTEVSDNSQTLGFPRMNVRGRGKNPAGTSWIYVGDASYES